MLSGKRTCGVPVLALGSREGCQCLLGCWWWALVMCGGVGVPPALCALILGSKALGSLLVAEIPSRG